MMEKEKLIQYLQDVYKLEIQGRIARNTMDEISKKYHKNKQDFNYSQQNHKVKKGVKQYVCLGLCIFMLIGVVAGISSINEEERLIAASSIPEDDYDQRMLDGKKDRLEDDREELLMFLLLAFISGGIYVWMHRKWKNEQEEVHTLYLMLGVTSKNSMQVYEENYKVLSAALKNTQEVLGKAYALNIIAPKYRYLEACGTFLEYLQSGRAHALEATIGYAGAYNLYEEELFRGVIKNQLNQVLQNQRVLIYGLKQISQKMDAITNSIEQVSKNVDKIRRAEEVNTFYNGVTAYNTMVMRRIMDRSY